jgi:hypothetical protein
MPDDSQGKKDLNQSSLEELEQATELWVLKKKFNTASFIQTLFGVLLLVVGGVYALWFAWPWAVIAFGALLAGIGLYSSRNQSPALLRLSLVFAFVQLLALLIVAAGAYLETRRVSSAAVIWPGFYCIAGGFLPLERKLSRYSKLFHCVDPALLAQVGQILEAPAIAIQDRAIELRAGSFLRRWSGWKLFSQGDFVFAARISNPLFGKTAVLDACVARKNEVEISWAGENTRNGKLKVRLQIGNRVFKNVVMTKENLRATKALLRPLPDC